MLVCFNPLHSSKSKKWCKRQIIDYKSINSNKVLHHCLAENDRLSTNQCIQTWMHCLANIKFRLQFNNHYSVVLIRLNSNKLYSCPKVYLTPVLRFVSHCATQRGLIDAQRSDSYQCKNGCCVERQLLVSVILFGICSHVLSLRYLMYFTDTLSLF